VRRLPVFPALESVAGRVSRPNAILIVAIALAVALLMLRCESDGALEIEIREPRPGIDEIRVDVAGAVQSPGVVIAEPGDRVIDAIDRAGGFAPDADREALNLSLRLRDQDRVVVPIEGAASPLIDVNSASAEELETLPGIGPVRSADIIEARERDGPFATTDDLITREVISDFVYEGIRGLVTAR